MFEWLGERARARAGTRACAANAVRVPAGVCDLVADSGVLLVIAFSNLIQTTLALLLLQKQKNGVRMV